MSFWILAQVLLNLVLLASVIALWMRLHRPQKDDPRLSKGLQLLQTKISVLEDLADRTETQVTQLTSLIEIKVREVQNQILLADKSIQQIESSMEKSKEVARIFQDRIPHQEIIERQNTIKYVKAARMAHQGASIEEIMSEVGISRGEAEFVAKVNRNNLQFAEEALPEWARDEEVSFAQPENEAPTIVVPQVEPQVTLSSLGEKFRQAVGVQIPTPAPVQAPISIPAPEPIPAPMPAPAIATPAPAPKPALGQTVVKPTNQPIGIRTAHAEVAENTRGQKVEVRKILFPKVEINSNLM